MLAKLNLKLIKVGGGSSGGIGIGPKSPASGTLASGSAGTPGAKLAAAVSHATPSKVSPLAPAGMTATLVADVDKDSTDSFRWDGDEDGVTFEDAHKPKALVSSYAPPSPAPSCCNLSMESCLPSPMCLATQLGNDIVISPTLIKSLLKAIPTTNGALLSSSWWPTPVPRTTWSLAATLSSHTSQFTVFGSEWVTIRLHWSSVVGWQSFHSMVIVFSFAMCFMSQNFGSHFTVYVPIFVSRGAVLWEATRLVCTFTSRAWS
jgi:hypothetical protein